MWLRGRGVQVHGQLATNSTLGVQVLGSALWLKQREHVLLKKSPYHIIKLS